MIAFFNYFHLYGFLVGVAIVVGILIVERASVWFHVPKQWLDGALPYIVVGAVVGARLYHLATDWQLYIHASFLDLIAIWRGGIGFLGGVVGGVIGLAIWVNRDTGQKVVAKDSSRLTHFFLYLDLLAFGIPVAQSIGRLGNFVNQELYGLPTNLPWGITINGQKYHPLFLYEALLNLVLFGFLIALARKRSLAIGKGQYVSVYLFGYALVRFWLEYLRIETARWDGFWGVFSIAQWVCLGLMVLATFLFWTRRHAPRKEFDISLE